MSIDLASAINDDAVEIGVVVDDWEAAVRRSGGLLVDVGAAEPRYVDAMVETVNELGPYIVLAPGVAIPHARPEMGALDVGISVMTLAEPVEFGAEDNDPVDLVFGLATNDKEAHTAALSALAEFLEDPDNLAALRAADDADDVIRLLKG